MNFSVAEETPSSETCMKILMKAPRRQSNLMLEQSQLTLLIRGAADRLSCLQMDLLTVPKVMVQSLPEPTLQPNSILLLQGAKPKPQAEKKKTTSLSIRLRPLLTLKELFH